MYVFILVFPNLVKNTKDNASTINNRPNNSPINNKLYG